MILTAAEVQAHSATFRIGNRGLAGTCLCAAENAMQGRDAAPGPETPMRRGAVGVDVSHGTDRNHNHSKESALCGLPSGECLEPGSAGRWALDG